MGLFTVRFQVKLVLWGRLAENQGGSELPAVSPCRLQPCRHLAVWALRSPWTAAAAAPAALALLTRSAAGPPWRPLSRRDPHQRMEPHRYLASHLPSTTCSAQDMLLPGRAAPHQRQLIAWIGWGVFLDLLGEAELSTQDTIPMQGSPGGPVTQPGLLTTLFQPESNGSRAWAVSTHSPVWQQGGTSIPTSLPLSIHHRPPASLKMLLWTQEGYRRSQGLELL